MQSDLKFSANIEQPIEPKPVRVICSDSYHLDQTEPIWIDIVASDRLRSFIRVTLTTAEADQIAAELKSLAARARGRLAEQTGETCRS